MTRKKNLIKENNVFYLSVQYKDIQMNYLIETIAIVVISYIGSFNSYILYLYIIVIQYSYFHFLRVLISYVVYRGI